MDGASIRQLFLNYFADRGHQRVASSPLIPRNDPSLFFANSGMVQFKNVFTGEEKRNYTRATTVQKCLRVSGKHNDLENVGVTPRHHTFFEMLGNFSFGDYFKQDAIPFAWNLLTNVLKLDPEKLWVTIFLNDDEAFEIWRDVAGIPEKRLARLGEKDNFWSMGDTGPCGPCSEIHIDRQAFAGKGVNPRGIIEDPEGYLEIWNLVFMQFERSANGTLTPLPRPSIDTGMGLERLASVLQGHASNYDTDLFRPIIARAESLSGHSYGRDDHRDTSMRVIADHSRATAFLIVDGVLPSNEERGYVLRRIMRRAIRHGVKLGLTAPFLFHTVDSVIEMMADAFPELRERRSAVLEIVENEERRFAETLDKGLKLYREHAEKLKSRDTREFPGTIAFKLSDTYGFPLDLTEIIAQEDGLTIDHAGYDRALEQQRELARQGWKGSGETTVSSVYQNFAGRGLTSTFVGYDANRCNSTVRALLRDGSEVNAVVAGDVVEVIVDQTPFYAESGGQVGDVGTIVCESASGAAQLQVSDTQSPVGGLIVHHAVVLSGVLHRGASVDLSIDVTRRDAIQRNHSATHLLHAALRTVLGTHVVQRGSLVAPDRLRFDFAHFKPMTPEEVRAVEDWVNRATLTNVGLEIRLSSLQDAISSGVMALFGEKYGDQVRSIHIPGLSAELCGGTHVNRSGDIGAFKILSEGGIQAGVRRIEALTGFGVIELTRTFDQRFRELADVLKVGVAEVGNRITRLLDERKELEKQVETLTRRLTQGTAGTTFDDRTRTIRGVKMISIEIPVEDPKLLREQADQLRDRIGSGIVVIGSRTADKVTLLAAVTKDLVSRISAGNLVKELAPLVDGSGGGRPDLAQAGGKSPEKLSATLEAAFVIADRHLS